MRYVANLFLSCLVAAAPLTCRAERSDVAVSTPKLATREIQFRSGDITLAGT